MQDDLQNAIPQTRKHETLVTRIVLIVQTIQALLKVKLQEVGMEHLQG